MRLGAGNSCVLWKVALLLTLCGVAAAHMEGLLGVCSSTTVPVECLPGCQLICTSILIIRRCIALECRRGCVCPPGWVRKGSIEGVCIKRSACRRWVL
ncbi:PREDICTED: SCO-spondin [Drosophila arizonae]|uniref:SCO-spondin n=1 Tax=Drosophila arizonae TaxID=7263 RepID=A0ABM1PEA0_DROAR|nr:PREDICTED: SCO-spondin [Drosophila arizonae]